MIGDYDRDMLGYGARPPKANWPGGARVAVQFVMNYEEGGENCILHGDDASESFLSDMIGTPALSGQRHMSMESLYEYGSRVGVWRLLDLFKRKEIPITLFAVAMAMERNPAAIEAALEAGAQDVESTDGGHEITCEPDDFSDVRDALDEKFGEPESARLDWKPQNSIAVEEDAAGTLLKLLDVLDDNDDVQRVAANFDIAEDVMERLSA